MKRIPPFENNRRTILSGAQFKPAESQEGKKNPFITDEIDPNVPLHQQFEGFSPLLSKEIDYRMKHNQSFSEIMDEIKHSTKLYLCNVNQEVQFHCIPLYTCRIISIMLISLTFCKGISDDTIAVNIVIPIIVIIISTGNLHTVLKYLATR